MKIRTYPRPYVLTFHASGHQYPMTQEEAQRLLDSQSVFKVSSTRVIFHGHNSTKAYDRTTLKAATLGGGPAFMIEEPIGKYVDTVWELRTYDVWGNAKDGYEINDVYTRERALPIRCKVQINNIGTASEFTSAHPSEYQLAKIFGTRAHLDVDGDDTGIFVRRASDGYPLGELRCVSHESLSPIRATKDTKE